MPVTRRSVRHPLGKIVAVAAAGAVLVGGCGHTPPTAPSLTAAAGTQPATITAVPPPVVRLSPEPPPATAPAVSTAAPTSTAASTPAETARPAATTPAAVAAPTTTTHESSLVPTHPPPGFAASPTMTPTPTSPRPPTPPNKRTAAPPSKQGQLAGGAVSDPQYSVDKIDHTAAQQVAWAYLVQRLSYSWHDSHAGDGIRRAARYTTPAKAAALLADLRNNSAGTWTTAQNHRVQASVTVRRMQWAAAASSTGGSVAVVVYFTRTFGEAGTIPTTTAGNTTLTLSPQPGGAWAVSADNFGTPD